MQTRAPRPLWQVALMHLIALGLALVLYALPHHVLPHREQSAGLVSDRASLAMAASSDAPAAIVTPAPEAEGALSAEAAPTPEPTATPEPTPFDSLGEFRIKFADRFSDTPVKTETSYVSSNLNLTFSQGLFENGHYNMAEIYIADIGFLQAAFAGDQYGKGYKEHPLDIARRWNAVVALSGDYYGARDDGVVIRNGQLYRNRKIRREVCALYWDGTMKVFDRDEFDAEQELLAGCYQAWNFGPSLLEDGHARTEFDSDVTGYNPRAVIGCYEPGHYCFLSVDGRQDDTRGMNLDELSRLCESLGLREAYNLDGGQTSILMVYGEAYGRPSKGARAQSDIIMVLDGYPDT